MARTITEIKKEMTEVFMANDTIKTVYGIDPDRSFEDQFSKASLESVLFYVVAACMWTLEKLFDRHKQEVDELISELKPHSLRWYANKAKAFRYGKSLMADTDGYDNTGWSEEKIRAQQVVKYAAVMEKDAVVYVKVATGEEGRRKPLTLDEKLALTAYFQEVKDAGVKLKVVNEPADEFHLEIDVYYDPQVFDNRLQRLDGTGQAVHDRVASFVENLPFNGEYRNSALINALTALEGVVLVELKKATANGKPVDAKCVPEAGYFRVDKKNLGIKAIAYETISDRL